MSKLDEFMQMRFEESRPSFDRDWLQDLQTELVPVISAAWWSQIIFRKLQDCYDDKASILNDLRNLAERCTERGIVLKQESGFEQDKSFGEKENFK